jgi:hypothetical protein
MCVQGGSAGWEVNTKYGIKYTEKWEKEAQQQEKILMENKMLSDINSFFWGGGGVMRNNFAMACVWMGMLMFNTYRERAPFLCRVCLSEPPCREWGTNDAHLCLERNRKKRMVYRVSSSSHSRAHISKVHCGTNRYQSESAPFSSITLRGEGQASP